MLPLIIVGDNEEKIKRYLNKEFPPEKFNRNLAIEIRPLREEITINQIRELKRDLVMIFKDSRLIVFYDFDKSGIEAQNSLLKVLEEKTGNNQFIMLVKNSEKILETIKSRAKIVNLTVSGLNQKSGGEIEKLIDRVKQSNNLRFFNGKEMSVADKEEAIAFCRQLIIYFRNDLKTEPKQIAVQIVRKILEVAKLIETNNLNPQLSIDNLLIFIWREYNDNNRYNGFKKL